MVLILMGVSGCGKTTVGTMLGQRLGLAFHDADQFHSDLNKRKMESGIPLNDEDRAPWLDALARAIAGWNAAGGAVLACSALKEQYRQTLSGHGSEKVAFIFLTGEKALLTSRLEARINHFFSPALLDSQLSALEPPANAIVVKIDKTPEAICREVIQELGSRGITMNGGCALEKTPDVL